MMNPSAGHPAIDRVRTALTAAGAPGAAESIRVLAASAPTAAAAADQLRCPVGAIANSLVFLAATNPCSSLPPGRIASTPHEWPRRSGSPA